MGNTCSAPGENGFVCESTFLDFSMDSNGTALDDASARIDSNPDIGGIAVFFTFVVVFYWSASWAAVIHLYEGLGIYRRNSQKSHMRHQLVKRAHHILSQTLKGFSDQQLILGFATSGALFKGWCSFSTYHLNLIKQWLVFCSLTHVNALLVHCDYFNPNHTGANVIRMVLTAIHTGFATYIIAFYGLETDDWIPTASDLAPLQTLNVACYFRNATRSNTLDDGSLGWREGSSSGQGLFIGSLILIGVALVLIGLDFFFRNLRKSWFLYGLRSLMLLANLGIGIAVFRATFNLREYMVKFNWLKDDEENELSYGQFVTVLSTMFLVITAAQSMFDEIPDREVEKERPDRDSYEMQ